MDRFRLSRLVLAFVGSVVTLALVPAGSLAATTVGQIGTPSSDIALMGGVEFAQTSAAMPAAGTVTSFQTQSSTCDFAAGAYDFQVLRPLGGGQYKVLGDTGNQTDPCDSLLHSYPVKIAVKAGDVIGGFVVSEWQGILSDSNGSFSVAAPIPKPAVGDTVTLLVGPVTGTVDESATLVRTQNGNSQGQNNNQQGQNN